MGTVPNHAIHKVHPICESLGFCNLTDPELNLLEKTPVRAQTYFRPMQLYYTCARRMTDYAH